MFSRKLSRILLFTLLFCAGAVSGVAQSRRTSRGVTDSVNASYQFKAGDEFIYRVRSMDTITISDAPTHTILNQRTETVRYTCRKASSEGFIISVTWLDYHATTKRDSLAEVAFTQHPWVGRTVTYLMNADGKRVTLFSSPDTSGVAPGGVFEPLLFPYLGARHTTAVGAVEMNDIQYWLFDNAIPPVLWAGSILRSTEGMDKRKGRKTLHLALSETGRITYKSADTKVQTAAVINELKDYNFALPEMYPVGGHSALMANLELRSPDGKVVHGRHDIGMEFELLEQKHASTKGARLNDSGNSSKISSPIHPR